MVKSVRHPRLPFACHSGGFLGCDPDVANRTDPGPQPRTPTLEQVTGWVSRSSRRVAELARFMSHFQLPGPRPGLVRFFSLAAGGVLSTCHTAGRGVVRP